MAAFPPPDPDAPLPEFDHDEPRVASPPGAQVIIGVSFDRRSRARCGPARSD